MRKEKDLNVNVHTRALRAAERTNGDSGRLPEVFDSPEPKWWQRYFKWETLTVAGRTIEKGLVLTPTMGLTVVLAIAAMMGTMYWRMSDRIEAKDSAYQQQRDMLIEIKTELKIAKEHDVEFKREQKDAQEIQDLKIQDLKDKLLVINAKRGN